MPPPSLTVITALGRWGDDEQEYFTYTVESVLNVARYLPTEWVIVIDEPRLLTHEVMAFLKRQVGDGLNRFVTLPQTLGAVGAGVRIVSSHSGSPIGPGLTRSRGLELANGIWCMYVDSDDILLGEGVARMIREAHSQGYEWTVGLTVDIDSSSQMIWEGPGVLLEPGEIRPGRVREYVTEIGTMPLICGSVAMKTAVLKTVGGWPDLRRGQDIAPVVVISERFSGWHVDFPVYQYRRHGNSRTHSARWQKTPPPWEVLWRMADLGTVKLDPRDPYYKAMSNTREKMEEN